MSQALRAVEATGPEGFLETGVAYVEWALDHPAHFQVMFRPHLVDEEDAALQEALAGLAEALMLGVGDFSGRTQAGEPGTNPLALAAWSMTHGFATLPLAGNLPGRAGGSNRPTADVSAGQPVAELARATLRHLARPD